MEPAVESSQHIKWSGKMESNSDEYSRMRSLVWNCDWTTLNNLRGLVDDLEILSIRIRGRNPEWDRAFRRAWGALEEVYAVMKDRGDSSPDATHQLILSSSIAKLKVLLAPPPSDSVGTENAEE
jgi:hypothetical protein